MTVQFDSECIDEAVDLLVNTLEKYAASFRRDLFTQQCNTNTSSNDTQKSQPWYTDTCREKKAIFYEYLSQFRKDKNERNRLNMAKSRFVFKNTLRQARFEYNCHQTSKLKMLKYKNAKDYWRLLKGTFCGKTPNTKLSGFTNYVRAVNNPNDLFTTDDDVSDLFERFIQGEDRVMFD